MAKVKVISKFIWDPPNYPLVVLTHTHACMHTCTAVHEARHLLAGEMPQTSSGGLTSG